MIAILPINLDKVLCIFRSKAICDYICLTEVIAHNFLFIFIPNTARPSPPWLEVNSQNQGENLLARVLHITLLRNNGFANEKGTQYDITNRFGWIELRRKHARGWLKCSRMIESRTRPPIFNSNYYFWIATKFSWTIISIDEIPKTSFICRNKQV